MKSKTNIFLLVSFIVATIITVWLNYQLNNVIGDIDENGDNIENFEVCNKRIFQYYQSGSAYEGGKGAIKEELTSELAILQFDNPGLITYRFIINCKGEIGRFRVKSTSLDLQERKVDSGNLEKIENGLLKLNNWKPAGKGSIFVDSYYVVNFKIRQGKIVDIF